MSSAFITTKGETAIYSWRAWGRLFQKKLMKRKGCHPMDFTGRPMKGYVSVDPNGFDLDEDLVFWLDHCIAFNPKATMAKKRKKK